jgi:hypothetical protein
MPPLSNPIPSDGSFNSLDGRVCNDKTTSIMTSNKRSVSFKTIEVREYERVLGDHPNTTHGPPMSIGWAFVEHDAIDLDGANLNGKRVEPRSSWLKHDDVSFVMTMITPTKNSARRKWTLLEHSTNVVGQ